MTAENVVRRTREQLRPVEEALGHHPYLAIVRAGEVPVEALKALPGHQHHMAISDMRSLAMMVHRFGETPYVAFFNGVLQGQLAERGKILRLAQKLGMSQAELENYDVEPEGFAYAAYLAWLASQGSAAEIVCGLLVNFVAWGHNCGQVSAALQAKYGLSADDTAFLDSFAAMPSFEDEALVIIQDGLDRGVGDDRIMRAARLIQGYERMFWDTMAKLAARPALVNT